jgi:ATP-dependent Clp protease ATP-binding subunit ClpC
MFARFTDRARKVMQLANQEAQKLNHEYIGTEHILLGLVKEGSGVAANVLKNLDIDLRKIRLEVEKIVQSGPDMVTMGKLPQTPRAKKVIEYSIEEARNFNHNYVGTEHLLVGLLREQEGVAGLVLMNLGLKLEDVREEVLSLLGHNMDSAQGLASCKVSSKCPARRLGIKLREHHVFVIFLCGLLATLAVAETRIGALAGGVVFVAAVAVASWTACTH